MLLLLTNFSFVLMTVRNNEMELNYLNQNDKNHINLMQQKRNVGSTKEQILAKDLNDIAQECVEIENMKRTFADIILKNQNDVDFSDFISHPNFFIKESFIKKEVAQACIRGLNVVSVDGSSVSKNFVNVDFSFLKAIAVKYYFYKNHNAKIEYFPDLYGFNNYSIQGNYINREEKVVETQVSMDMTYMEINLLNKLIERSSDIDLIIIDGSIVIMPINLLFSKDFEISQKYDELLREYHRLYLNCREKRILLIGSIKDSRSSALTNLLKNSIQLLKPNHSKLNDFIKINYRQIFDYFSDLDLFNRILRKSERSCVFNCKREIDKIRETGIKKEISYYFPFSFCAFYLKSVKYDVPCRIEFFLDENHTIKEASKKADLISSMILPISNLNEYYGLPIPQVEAHKRAVFNPNEINLLFNNLKRRFNKHGIELLEKRRNRRPF